MQILKEEIKNNIVKAAKVEFLQKDFENASIVCITRRAKTSKSNVYNYFPNKDALFCEIVENTRKSMDDFLAQLKTAKPNLEIETYTLEAQKAVILDFVNLMMANKEDFRLLFFKSAGSSMNGYKNLIIDSFADALEIWINTISPKRNLSRFFISSIARFYVSPIEQYLLQDEAQEIRSEHMQEFLLFVYGGWKNLLQTNNRSD